MALTGTYERSLDEKFRLAVPKPLRDEIVTEEDPNLYLAPETEGTLAVFSPAAFENRAARLAEQPPGQLSVRQFLRMFYSQAERTQIDKQGRLRIPERLVQHANLTSDVVIVGVHDHAEIWNRDAWTQFWVDHRNEFDRLADEAYR